MMDAIKVLVLGAPKSGKTWLISRLVKESLPRTYRPTVETFSTTLYNTEIEEQEKTFLFHFFEVGSNNDMLYKLYAVMCEVFIVVVDCANPAGTQDALLLIDKIRTMSPEAGRSNIITVATKFEGSNCSTMLPHLGDIYPHITTSSRLNLGVEEIKSQVIALRQARRKLQRSVSARLSIRERINITIEKRHAKQTDKENNKQFHRLLSNSDEEITNAIDHQIAANTLIPPQPTYSRRMSTPRSSLCSNSLHPTSENGSETAQVNVLLDPVNHKQPLGGFSEIDLLPRSQREKRKFFHLCHLIEVPPIVFERPEPQGITERLNAYACNIKEKISCFLSIKTTRR